MKTNLDEQKQKKKKLTVGSLVFIKAKFSSVFFYSTGGNGLQHVCFKPMAQHYVSVLALQGGKVWAPLAYGNPTPNTTSGKQAQVSLVSCVFNSGSVPSPAWMSCNGETARVTPSPLSPDPPPHCSSKWSCAQVETRVFVCSVRSLCFTLMKC